MNILDSTLVNLQSAKDQLARCTEERDSARLEAGRLAQELDEALALLREGQDVARRLNALGEQLEKERDEAREELRKVRS